MFNFLSKFFKSTRAYEKQVEEINKLEPEIKALSDVELKARSLQLKEEISNSQSEIRNLLITKLPIAFALVREAARRTLGQRHFDVQLIGGMVLHEGMIAEMATGEGKTLAATAPAYLNALTGKGVHVVTVNEYLAKRDTVWMGQIYNALGLSVACLVHEGALVYDPAFKPENPKSEIRNSKQIINSNDQNSKRDEKRDTTGSFKIEESYLRPISRREAYQMDILYGTNHEFGFDYLRDNLAYSVNDQVQCRVTTLNFAIIDEVDSILIDEARTPLIISAPDQESSQYYKTFARLVRRLEKNIDYLVDEKLKSVDITAEGINKAERELKIENIYAPENMRLTHYLQECLRAEGLFQRDRDYVVKNGEIIIVDQFTGRLMPGRRYSGGLHQAIEAKEGVSVQNESRTYAQISIQNYFRLYKKLAGMTGTAQTSAEEFDKVYHLEVVSIPPNRKLIRKDVNDVIYKNIDAKFDAIAKEIKERSEKGQPVLVGTVSIEKNEDLARRLSSRGIKYEILNAKNNEREAAIIAQAGRAGAVTVATNMAGRGVDIILGGNPPDVLEAQKVRDLGGLHVIGTERHEARRIDNQLRGRSGRQGDPGSTQFFLSLEDDLMRVFGGERIKNLMTRLDVPDDTPIEAKMVSRAVSQAQSKIEGINFDARKHLLEYDDVLNKQRLAIYAKRQELLRGSSLRGSLYTVVDDRGNLTLNIPTPQILSALDFFWMTHLEDMEHLSESVRLRAYGQHDPLVEYRREGHRLYQQMLAHFDEWLSSQTNVEQTQTNADLTLTNADSSWTNAENSEKSAKSALSQRESAVPAYAGTGRNKPCPCGATKQDGQPIKFKRCHGS